jgi:hypothetical protein
MVSKELDKSINLTEIQSNSSLGKLENLFNEPKFWKYSKDNSLKV